MEKRANAKEEEERWQAMRKGKRRAVSPTVINAAILIWTASVMATLVINVYWFVTDMAVRL